MGFRAVLSSQVILCHDVFTSFAQEAANGIFTRVFAVAQVNKSTLKPESPELLSSFIRDIFEAWIQGSQAYPNAAS